MAEEIFRFKCVRWRVTDVDGIILMSHFDAVWALDSQDDRLIYSDLTQKNTSPCFMNAQNVTVLNKNVTFVPSALRLHANCGCSGALCHRQSGRAAYTP